MHTYPLLSIYEKTSILGLRMSQLEHGAKSTLTPQEISKCKNVKDIAAMEFQKKKIPIKVVREGKEVSIHELIVV